MPNAFTLHGELRADTRNFESALQRAQRQLQASEKDLDRLERKTKLYGQTSSTSGRAIERQRESLGQLRQRLNDATQAYDQGTLSHRKMASVLTQTDGRLAGFNTRIKDSTARLRDWRDANTGLSTAMGAAMRFIGPMGLAFGAFATKASMSLENTRNKFIALEGSVDKANARIQQLLNLSRKSVGVNFDDAVEGFQFLKIMGTVGEQNIEKMIQALGRLKIAFGSTMQSSTDMLINLQQLFDQGFEAQDWKQAIGRVPIWEQIVEKAFGSKDPEKLRELKEAGKLTMDTWIAGLAEASNNDARLKDLGETFSIKLSKALSEVNLQLAPVGDKIVAAIQPILDKAIAEFAKPTPRYYNIVDEFGKSIGRAIAGGIKSGLQSEQGSFGDFLNSWVVGGGLTAPIGKGLLEGAGFEGSTKGLRDAFLSIGKAVVQASEATRTAFMNMHEHVRAFIAKTVTWGPEAAAAGYQIGSQIGQGLINGIKAWGGRIAGAIRGMVRGYVVAPAEGGLGISSPSKVFFKIGEQVAQGFIDGIASMRTGIQSAMASVLDVSGLKGVAFGKGDADGVSYLSSLIKKLDELTPRTNLEAALAELTAKKYEKLNAAVKERIILAAKQLDFHERFKNFTGIPESGGGDSGRPEETSASGSGPLLGMTPEEYEAWLESLNQKTAAMMKAIGTPPPLQLWANFWDQFAIRVQQIRDSLPSLNETLGENVLNGLEGLSTGLGQALTRWEGGFKNMFRNIVASFAQMAQQIAAEMIRLIILQNLLKIFGSWAGGALSPVGGAAQSVAGGAAGGVAGGMGGLGGLAPAFGGGDAPTYNRSNTFNINVSGSTSPAATASMIAREVSARLRMNDYRNK